MKKRAGIVGGILLVLLTVFFLPVPRGTLDDGGTRIYAALTYEIVVWNKLISMTDESGTHTVRYHRTSVFRYPDNLNLPGELWKLETARHPGESGS